MGIPFPDPPVLASEVEVLDGLFQNLAASVVVNDLGHIQEAGELCFREWLATLRVVELIKGNLLGDDERYDAGRIIPSVDGPQLTYRPRSAQ